MNQQLSLTFGTKCHVSQNVKISWSDCPGTVENQFELIS